MLPGVDGRLLSIAFLERRLAAEGSVESIEPLQRHLVDWRARAAAIGPASPPRTLLQSGAVPFFAALGFEPPSAIQAAGPALAATLRSNCRPIALIVAPWGEAFDPLWRLAVIEAGRRGARWSLLFDSLHLRVVDAERVYARRHLEFDLDLVVNDSRGVVALRRTVGAGALGAIPASTLSLDSLVVASDQHALGVCQSLRQGVLSASRDVLAALVSMRSSLDGGRRPRRAPGEIDDSFEQALTIVYRMLFLFFAEARLLVPLWHPIYRESYSLEAVRDAAERRRVPRAMGDASGNRTAGARRLPRRGASGHAVQRPAVRALTDTAGRASRPRRRSRETRGHGTVDAARSRSRWSRAHRIS